jgi:hypothetical protein
MYQSFIVESWLQVLLNPFQDKTTPIKSAGFDSKIKSFAKKYFG